MGEYKIKQLKLIKYKEMRDSMDNWKKYEKSYFMPPEPCYDWVKKGRYRQSSDLVQRGSARREPGADRAYEFG